MPREPTIKRAVAFVDGQNLFNAAKEAFGYSYPNYDIRALVEAVCNEQGWQIEGIRFYTGIPDAKLHPGRHGFWANKLAAMGQEGIYTFRRPVRLGLTRFRGHFDTESEGGVHDAEDTTSVPTRVSGPNRRTGAGRKEPRRVGSGVRALGQHHSELGPAGGSG